MYWILHSDIRCADVESKRRTQFKADIRSGRTYCGGGKVFNPTEKHTPLTNKTGNELFSEDIAVHRYACARIVATDAGHALRNEAR
jgi:hypothetical protein